MHFSYRSNNFWKAPWKSTFFEFVNDFRHSLFYLFICLITIAAELRE